MLYQIYQSFIVLEDPDHYRYLNLALHKLVTRTPNPDTPLQSSIFSFPAETLLRLRLIKFLISSGNISNPNSKLSIVQLILDTLHHAYANKAGIDIISDLYALAAVLFRDKGQIQEGKIMAQKAIFIRPWECNI